MLRAVRSNRVLVVLMIALGVITFACRDASSPTAPEPPEQSGIVSQTSFDVAPPPDFDLWATLLADPRMGEIGGQTWVKLEASCKLSDKAPESKATLMCPPDLAAKCAALHVDSKIVTSCMRMDKGGRKPMYKVTSLEVLD